MRPEDYKSRTNGLKFEASRSGWSKPGNQNYKFETFMLTFTQNDAVKLKKLEKEKRKSEVERRDLLLWQELLGLLCKCACMVGMGFRATKRQKGFYLILFHFTCFLFLSNCSSSPFSHNRDCHKSCYKIPISAFSPFYFIFTMLESVLWLTITWFAA